MYMKFEQFFKPKSEEQLKEQAILAENVLGENMYPPDMSVENVLDISNIKEEYKTRYDAYVTSLRSIHQGNVDTEDIKHAKEWVLGLNNLDTYIKEHESKENPLLREKQYIVYKEIRNFLEQGKRNGYVKLPTGTGKTILFLKIAEALDMKTLVVSPSTVILGQNAEETEEFTESEFGKYYGQEKDLSKKVTHITYHSLVNAVRDGIIKPEDYPVVILDEAHRSLGSERTQTIDKFDSINNIKLYFTATPEFSNYKKLSNNLEEIFRMDVAEGIREGLICQTQTIHAYTNIDLSNVDITHGQFNQEQLEKVINVSGRNLAALDLYKNKFSHLKVFCNCTGVNHAQDVTKLFNEKGINAACITGNTPKKEREKILKDYKEGVIKVLTNARVLLEGFNEPSCSVTFNLHPTLSLVDAEQRARSGRLDKNDDGKWSYVVDFIDQNSIKPQVLYSEILGSDRVWDISNSETDSDLEPKENSKQKPTQQINFDNFNIEGLKVVVDAQKIMEITKSNLEFRDSSNQEAPSDWLTASDITKKYNYSYHQVRDLVKDYMEINPSYIKLYKGNNNVMTEYCSPECINKIIEKINSFQEVPPGWMNAHQICKKFNLNYFTLKNFIEKYKVEDPDCFKICKSGSQITEYYDLNFINEVKDNLFNETLPAPDGWSTSRALGLIVGSGYSSMEKFTKEYREKYPEWFKEYKTKQGLILEHLSPEMVDIIKKEKLKIKTPEGWFNASTLRDVFRVSDVTIRNFVEKFRDEHPDWFNQYQSGPKISEHYSPELVDIIKDNFKIQSEILEAPKGWETTSKISSSNNIDYGAVKNFAKKFKESNHKWFKYFKTPKIAEHYSPELVEIILKHFKEMKTIQPPEEGWVNSYTLAKELGRDTVKIKALVLPYRDEHPDWFRQFKVGNMIAEHYSPELIDIIRNIVLNSKRRK